jgi:hypothetical protein
MARFNVELPNDIMKQFETVDKNTDKMLAEMTKAGAEAVLQSVRASVPASWRSSNIMQCLRITKSYKTPSDDGVNTKVAFYGYFIDEDGRRKAAPLVANVTEYGRSNSPYPKKPFMRKSFNKAKITKAMEEVQKKYIPEG